ncbi:MAG: hypothetical protein ACK5DJ_01870, partial [Bacteroidota bacterium]
AISDSAKCACWCTEMSEKVVNVNTIAKVLEDFNAQSNNKAISTRINTVDRATNCSHPKTAMEKPWTIENKGALINPSLSIKSKP